MNTQKLNDWLQLVGMAGVIASLIFVGLQLRQTQRIAMSDAYQTRAYGSVEMNMATTMSPKLLSAQVKLWSGKQDRLQPEEIVALAHEFYANMDTLENNEYQFRSGFLSEDHWLKNVDQLRCRFSQPIYREFWEPYEYRKSFAELVNGIIRDAELNPSDCWEYDEGSIWDWD